MIKFEKLTDKQKAEICGLYKLMHSGTKVAREYSKRHGLTGKDAIQDSVVYRVLRDQDVEIKKGPGPRKKTDANV